MEQDPRGGVINESNKNNDLMTPNLAIMSKQLGIIYIQQRGASSSLSFGPLILILASLDWQSPETDREKTNKINMGCFDSCPTHLAQYLKRAITNLVEVSDTLVDS